MSLNKNVKALHADLKVEWQKNVAMWIEISKYVGIAVDIKGTQSNLEMPKDDPDFFVDDPTATISVNQAGDYLAGVMWGTGQEALDLVPSRYVTELVDEATVKDFYDFATNQTLYHMNHAEAGLSVAIKPYTYDQLSFGTSGIGIFKNEKFSSGIEDNALSFSSYGVDSLLIDEGKSGTIEIVFATYNWKTNRIIAEFATGEKGLDADAMANLPKEIQKAYNSGDYNKRFPLVFGFFPRDDFDPRLKGKRGTKYKGVWFLDSGNKSKIFFEEDFADKPIVVARPVKVRGSVYGRSSGTMLISSIKSGNFMLGDSIEIIEKMARPSMGVFTNAIFGDSVLDTSSESITVFNPTLSGNAPPIFPIQDIGNPSALVEFLIPYLNEKIVTGFKVDSLLDFSTSRTQTATESLQRFQIRGKSLSGMLMQQETEFLIPTVKRSVGLLLSMGELGANPEENPQLAQRLSDNQRPERIIPDAVLQVIASGRPWYEIKFKNELSRIIKTEAVNALLQIIQAVTAISGLYPQIVGAVDWYTLLKDINDSLDAGSKILLTEREFKAQVAAQAQLQAETAKLQAGQAQASIQKDSAQAALTGAEAINAQ